MFRRKTQPDAAPFLVAIRDADPNGPVTVMIDADQLAGAEEAGLILADFAKHLARALAAAGKSSSEEAALAGIRALFEAELDSPTQDVEGNLAS